MNLIRKLYQKYLRTKDPALYWRSLGAVIGERSHISPSAVFGSEPYLIRLGEHVRVNSNVNFITHDGGVWVLRERKPENRDIDLFGQIIVGDNVHIGTGATIMPGITIGSNCVIGCGAIVTKDIPSGSVAVGIPARVIESIDEYEQKHIHEFVHTKNLSSEEKREFLLKQFSTLT